MVWSCKAVVLGLSLALLSTNLPAASSGLSRGPQLRSVAAMVQDEQTGETLILKRATLATPIASITKLMTAMVVLDARLDMTESIVILREDVDRLRHSISRLPVDTRLTRSQTMLLALMASENRAAHALGRTYPGGITAAVSAMNKKARDLGLLDTRFVEPTGLSDGNVSSALDLSRLVEMARRYDTISTFTTQRECTIQRGRRQLHFVNTNALIRNPHWRIGLSKTGYIEEGGRCLVMQTQVGSRSVLIVLLNASGKYTHFADAIRIRQWIEASNNPSKPGLQTQRHKAVNPHHV